ncbi:purine and uridine phosphorylase [Trichoderma citrinoviride]|uniref:Purine and uridine phosphorylase n=1 Tax=Trichoderma citrinoviride TaxID=58853 RepID=A0A2T4BBW7_9HYPO|nr:purine and uridine phosphorylase [Trichoderma citrinoviride]PTB66817.1 purine and uridine phosphorylase [Trichoderma citrinoviride]
MVFPRPSQREDFEIAFICALEVEFEALCLVVDEFWDEEENVYGKVDGDANNYRTGRIGKHNVVLLLLSRIGKVSAANAASSLRASFPRLRLAALVGGCAAAPRSKHTDILLGDVIISTGVVQYDLGSKHPGGFVRKDGVKSSLGKPHKEIENILAALQVSTMKDKLTGRTASLLLNMQESTSRLGYGVKYQYPGIREDRLFEANYLHKHRATDCIICNQSPDAVCKNALRASCEELNCQSHHSVYRKRLEEKLLLCQKGDISHQNPAIWFGTYGSGDTVMRSGQDRDTLAFEEDVIAFEMEAAGIWEELPSIVIKGAFDYGDSHKNKRWQAFASATAACATRAIVEQLAWTDRRELMMFTQGRVRHCSCVQTDGLTDTCCSHRREPYELRGPTDERD